MFKLFDIFTTGEYYKSVYSISTLRHVILQVSTQEHILCGIFFLNLNHLCIVLMDQIWLGKNWVIIYESVSCSSHVWLCDTMDYIASVPVIL